MDSAIVASKALVQVCAQPQDGATSYQCLMDVVLDKDTFSCKFRSRVQLVGNAKKVFVHLFLDASHVQSLEICDNGEAIPPEIENALLKRAPNVSSDGITTLRFALKSHAHLIVPDSVLHKSSSCEDLEALLRIGKCETFNVYVLSSAISRERLSSLCIALAEGLLQPAPEGVLSNLYVNSSYRKITQVDQVWSSNPNQPSCGPSTALGASKDEFPGPSDTKLSNSSRGHGKRRSMSPDLLQIPSKRQALTEDAAENPIRMILDAQKAQEAQLASLQAKLSAQGAQISTLQAEVLTKGTQITALQAELTTLREQVQQPQQAPVVDTEIQSDPPEYEAVIAAEADLPDEAHTPASTVEDPIHDQFMMFGETFDERFAEKFEELFVKKFEEVFEENFDEIFDKKFEGRLYKVEMDLLDQGPFRWKLEERVGRKIEHVRVELEEKLEDSNKQVCAH